MKSIKEARIAAGLTRTEMHEAFEIPKRTIEDWEAGRRKPPAYVEKLIIEKLESMVGEDDDESEVQYPDEIIEDIARIQSGEPLQKYIDAVKERRPEESDEHVEFLALYERERSAELKALTKARIKRAKELGVKPRE